ncbi:MAG: hypothetical protein U5L04_01775 [Trueperaceae bacterium]|nr:hypothetical protein [Trueperaceae bacterium]
MHEGDDKPWVQREGETEKQYEAFRKYMNLDANERTALHAWYDYAEWNWGKSRASQERAKDLDTAPGYFRNWSYQHDWVERAKAFDAHIASIEFEKREKEALDKLEEHREKQLQWAKIMREQSIGLMKKLNDRISELKTKDLEDPNVIARLIRANVESFKAATEAEAHALGVYDLATLLLEQQD